ncbi:MAG: nitroreductase family protein [Deltaproteobacteria bacterium]|nr:nitroreductase family protein [Deltaproteobacteria bacterium]
MELKHLKERYSVKKFDENQKLGPEQIQWLKDAFYLCPSSFNSQPWKMIIVENDARKKALAAAGKDTNGDCIKECSHLLVLVRRPMTMSHAKKVIETTPIFQKLIERMKVTTGKLAAFLWVYSKKHGGRHWTQNQVYLATGFLLAACASAGIGALPMEGINARKMDKLLKLPAHERTVLAIAVGMPHADDAQNPSRLQKSRLPLDEVVATI